MEETKSPVVSSPPATPSAFKRVEWAFENVLWHSRLLTIIAVVFSVLVACMMFTFATIDALGFCTYAFKVMVDPSAGGPNVRLELVAKVVKVVDLYLVATFMLIFPMGLYELFIGKIDAAEKSDVAKRLLLIHDLDDLKDRLTKILMLILAMLFLEYGLNLSPSSFLDLLFLSVGTVLTAVSLFLTQRKKASKDTH